MTTGQGTAGVQGELWGARARDWADYQEPKGEALYREAIARTGIGEGTYVLDVGCGTGVFAALASEAGARVSGIDAAQPSIEIARERVPGGDFRVGDLQFLPYDGDSFEVVTALNSIQYAADPVAAAAEAKRVAKLGGLVFVLVWGREDRTELVSILHALRPLLPPPPPGAPGPFALSGEGALEAVLQGGGLSIKDAGYLDAAFEYPNEEAVDRANLSPGPAVLAIRTSGEEAVRKALMEAFAPFRTSDGGYRIESEWRYVLAVA